MRGFASVLSLPLLLSTLLGPPSGPVAAGVEEDPPRATPAEEDGATADEQAPAVRATAGGTDLPVGVTLLGPRPPHAIAREALKPGVTLHAPAPRANWPRVTIRPSGPASVEARRPDLPLTLALPSIRPAVRPPRVEVSPPPVPRTGEQLAPPPVAPLTLWSAFPGGADWVPIAAYPPGDPERPYPWNAVSWPPPGALDPEWVPVSAWPEGVSADDWSPVLWNPLPAWTEWLPTDAWSRDLEVPGIGDAAAPQD